MFYTYDKAFNVYEVSDSYEGAFMFPTRKEAVIIATIMSMKIVPEVKIFLSMNLPALVEGVKGTTDEEIRQQTLDLITKEK